MNPTQEQIAKLPKWAQRHLANVTRERDEALRRMESYLDDQTPSSIYYEDLTRVNSKTSFPRRYVQTNRMTFAAKGVELTVTMPQDSDRGVELSWGPEGCHGLGDLCFIPTAYQQARITNMAYTPYEYERLMARKDKSS